ncbi:MAG: GHKL domain-containing protein [Gammaproteobacteria bacterium]|jgi:signal transduction histidine kinase|nr:GHKL domain-containing protein [Gammaproteobacteria bacterium]MBT5634509.1 GHKL domain-containing protein [Gammaproteobacteria bacterium]MBT6670921.1 GHKL domain-containing protein [Gammaproteobacteria bacterium]
MRYSPWWQFQSRGGLVWASPRAKQLLEEDANLFQFRPTSRDSGGDEIILTTDEGKVLLRLVADPQQEDLREILRLAPYGGVIDQEVHSEERELIDRQGELIPVLWSGALLRNQQFGIRGALFSLRDLRPQQLQEQHRRSMERERHHAQKMASIGTLAGGVAHEFNNMLQPIMGFSALLLEQEQAHHRLPEKDFERLELIHQSAKRGSELVRQILDFSRKDQELPDQEQSMDALLAMALKMVRGTLPPGVQLYERISQQLGRVQINSTAFHQLLLNLCGNAVQAIAATDLEKGEITITAVRDTEQHCTITVKDNGEGMEEEVRKQVFDPFFTTRLMGEGSGMGLSVALGIVERAGGTIGVESERGRGTIFTVSLPVQ